VVQIPDIAPPSELHGEISLKLPRSSSLNLSLFLSVVNGAETVFSRRYFLPRGRHFARESILNCPYGTERGVAPPFPAISILAFAGLFSNVPTDRKIREIGVIRFNLWFRAVYSQLSLRDKKNL
jgi:hypothetical protein